MPSSPTDTIATASYDSSTHGSPRAHASTASGSSDTEPVELKALSQPTKYLSSYTIDDDLLGDRRHPVLDVPSDLSDDDSDDDANDLDELPAPLLRTSSLGSPLATHAKARAKEPRVSRRLWAKAKATADPSSSNSTKKRRPSLSDMETDAPKRQNNGYQFSLDRLLDQKERMGITYSKLECMLDAKLLDDTEEVEFVYNRADIANQVMRPEQQQRIFDAASTGQSQFPQQTFCFAACKGRKQHDEAPRFSSLAPPTNTATNSSDQPQDCISVMCLETAGRPLLAHTMLRNQWLMRYQKRGWLLPPPLAQWLWRVIAYATKPDLVLRAYQVIGWSLQSTNACRRIKPAPAHAAGIENAIPLQVLWDALRCYGVALELLEPSFRLPPSQSATSPPPAAPNDNASVPLWHWQHNCRYLLRAINQSLGCYPAQYSQGDRVALVKFVLCCALDPTWHACRDELEALLITIMAVYSESQWSDELPLLTHTLISMVHTSIGYVLPILRWIPRAICLSHPWLQCEFGSMGSLPLCTSAPNAAKKTTRRKPGPRLVKRRKHRTESAKPLSQRSPPVTIAISDDSDDDANVTYYSCSSDTDTHNGNTAPTHPPTLPFILNPAKAVFRCLHLARVLAFATIRSVVHPINTTANPSEPQSAYAGCLAVEPLWHAVDRWLDSAEYFQVHDGTDYSQLHTVLLCMDHILVLGVHDQSTLSLASGDSGDPLPEQLKMVSGLQCLLRICQRLKRLNSQIVDAKAAFLDRTRAKDTLQQIFMRLDFTVGIPSAAAHLATVADDGLGIQAQSMQTRLSFTPKK
ncbi:hypothetical protein H4R34_002016 [Dimargaris verticillata]|uniref:Coiled-coil SMC6 And NSE5 INteracting (CANIN) domain-containing protein n=1 Tax=Dimargaris verticillata TaxID=2761393 RepID=A0A9W8B9M1_9FUNG|nr:hypothetical protein H4R34_002016 [Dimargaris verticillata]